MTNNSAERIRALVREVIASDRAPAERLTEGAEPLDFSSTLAGTVGASSSDRRLVVRGGSEAASQLVLAGINIKEDDDKAAKHDSGLVFSFTTKDSTGKEVDHKMTEKDLPSGSKIGLHADSINLFDKLRAVPGFGEISERSADGIRIMSTGDIWTECTKEARDAVLAELTVDAEKAMPRAMDKFVHLLGVKISAVAMTIYVLKQVEQRVQVTVAVEAALKMLKSREEVDRSEQDKADIVTQAVKSAQAKALENTVGLEEVAKFLRNLQNKINNLHKGMLAVQGHVVNASGTGYDYLPSTPQVLTYLRSTGNEAVISQMNNIFRYADKEENVKNGPLYTPILHVFDKLLDAQGLSVKRGEEGKGIVRNEETDGSFKLRDLKIMTWGQIQDFQELNLRGLIEKITSRSGNEEIYTADTNRMLMSRLMKDPVNRDGSGGRISGLLKKAASTAGSDITDDYITGKGEENQAQKIVTSNLIPAFQRIQTELKNATRVATAAGATLEAEWQRSAYDAFIRPMASALNSTKFTQTKSLADLREYREDAVRNAAEDRPSANSLKSKGPEPRTRLMLGKKAETGGLYILDGLLASCTVGYINVLELRLGMSQDEEEYEEEDEEEQSAVVSHESLMQRQHLVSSFATALSSGRKRCREIIAEAVMERLADLRSIVREAKESRNPAFLRAIKDTYSGLGGGPASLIDALSRGVSIADPLSYFDGTAIDPIRQADIDAANITALALKPPESSTVEAAAQGDEMEGKAKAMTPEEQADRETRRRQARDAAAADTVRRARQAEEDTRSGGQVGSAEVPSLFGATRSPYSDDELDEGRLLESLMRALRARASRRPMDLRS